MLGDITMISYFNPAHRGIRIKAAGKHDLRQCVELQYDAIAKIRKPEITTQDFVSLVRCWRELVELKRILRGQLKPGSFNATLPQELDSRSRRPVLDIKSIRDVMELSAGEQSPALSSDSPSIAADASVIEPAASTNPDALPED